MPRGTPSLTCRSRCWWRASRCSGRSVILVDADADGAMEAVARVRELSETDAIDVVFLGKAGEALSGHRRRACERGERVLRAPGRRRGAPAEGGGAHGGAEPSRPAPDHAASVVPVVTSPPSGASRRSPRRACARPRSRPSARATPPPARRGVPLLGSAMELSPPSIRKLTSVQAPLSGELEALLVEAEQRIGGQIAHESMLPSPEEEIEAVSPRTFWRRSTSRSTTTTKTTSSRPTRPSGRTTRGTRPARGRSPPGRKLRDGGRYAAAATHGREGGVERVAPSGSEDARRDQRRLHRRFHDRTPHGERSDRTRALAGRGVARSSTRRAASPISPPVPIVDSGSARPSQRRSPWRPCRSFSVRRTLRACSPRRSPGVGQACSRSSRPKGPVASCSARGTS